MQYHKTPHSQNISEQKEYQWGCHSESKINYRAIVIESIWYQQQNRHVDKGNKISTCDSSQLIVGKEAKQNKTKQQLKLKQKMHYRRQHF